MAKRPLNDQEIIELISKLRDETPDYPPEMMKSSKSGFMERMAEMRDSGDDNDGKSRYGGSGGGSSSEQITWSATGALGGGSATSGLSSKSALIIGIVVVLITLAFLFRAQIVDYLEENEIIAVTETTNPSSELLLTVPTETPTSVPQGFRLPEVTGTLRANDPSSGLASTPGSAVIGNENQEGVPVTGGSESAQTTLTPVISPPTPTPTRQVPDNSITGRLRYIVCILQGGGGDCE